MTEPSVLPADRSEQRRQQRLEDRERHATRTAGGIDLVPRPALSFAAETLQRALPRELIAAGAIRFDTQGQPRVATYDPSLLAPNPQRGRVLDRGLDELAASLDSQGQQEPILCRLITDTDRQRWPGAFSDRQILLILNGHRLYYAHPKTGLTGLRIELMLPHEREDDTSYARRALRRAALKLMHSQGYDIFDKVNQYMVWRQEFSLQKPRDSDIASYFEISRSEAQRVKAVAQLDPEVAKDILNAERRPADEVVYLIASRQPEQHRDAYRRYGHLTVAAARRLLKADDSERPSSVVTGAGRPRNYALAIRDEPSDIAYISSSLTPTQWHEKGGDAAFIAAVRSLLNDARVLQRLRHDLGIEDKGPTSGSPQGPASEARS